MMLTRVFQNIDLSRARWSPWGVINDAYPRLPECWPVSSSSISEASYKWQLPCLPTQTWFLCWSKFLLSGRTVSVSIQWALSLCCTYYIPNVLKWKFNQNGYNWESDVISANSTCCKTRKFGALLHLAALAQRILCVKISCAIKMFSLKFEDLLLSKCTKINLHQGHN
jgi:hypothetical protein